MVPSVLRYVEKANQANCKSDAATILVDIQAQIADKASSATTITTADTFTSSNVTVTVASVAADPAATSATKQTAKVQLVGFLRTMN